MKLIHVNPLAKFYTALYSKCYETIYIPSVIIQLVSMRARIEAQAFLTGTFPMNCHDIFPGLTLHSVPLGDT